MATHIKQIIGIIGRRVLSQTVGQLGVVGLGVILVSGVDLQSRAVRERHRALLGVLGQLEGEVVRRGGHRRSVVLVLDANLGKERSGRCDGRLLVQRLEVKW